MESTGFQKLKSPRTGFETGGLCSLVLITLELKVPHLLDYVYHTGLLSVRGLQDVFGRYHSLQVLLYLSLKKLERATFKQRGSQLKVFGNL